MSQHFSLIRYDKHNLMPVKVKTSKKSVKEKRGVEINLLHGDHAADSNPESPTDMPTSAPKSAEVTSHQAKRRKVLRKSLNHDKLDDETNEPPGKQQTTQMSPSLTPIDFDENAQFEAMTQSPTGDIDNREDRHSLEDIEPTHSSTSSSRSTRERFTDCLLYTSDAADE